MKRGLVAVRLALLLLLLRRDIFIVDLALIYLSLAVIEHVGRFGAVEGLKVDVVRYGLLNRLMCGRDMLFRGPSEKVSELTLTCFLI
jgi:hypothetical protein